jgi:hypothetical protein
MGAPCEIILAERMVESIVNRTVQNRMRMSEDVVLIIGLSLALDVPVLSLSQINKGSRT